MRSRNDFALFLSFFFLLLAYLTQTLWAGEKRKKTIPEALRVTPPERWDEGTEQLFGGNPLRRLKGPRVVRGKQEDGREATSAHAEKDTENAGMISWEALISAAAVEDEIKGVYPEIGQHLTRVGSFKSGAHQTVEHHFAMIAVMFGILAEHADADRWKDNAASARDLFSTASRNASVSSSQAFKDAKRRYEDLGQMMRGEKIELVPPRSEPWSQVIDRRQLMQRLERAYEQRMKMWSADQSIFENNRMAIIHEAQIVSALAKIITQPEYDFYDDDEYLAYCDELAQNAKLVGIGAREGDLQKVQFSLGEMHKSCSRCHEGYK